MTEAVPDFDLLTESWIPCVNPQGGVEEVGVLEVFERAHELQGISDASPLVTCALYRFLEAVLHQSLALNDEDEWAQQWQQGRFDVGLIAAIKEACAGRMNLFDEDHPFYQSGDIPLHEKPKKKLKTVGSLAPEASTATNIAHFDHEGDADHAFCPVCCTKGLIVLPAFAIGSGRGYGGAYLKNSINGRPPVYVLPLGETVFQDLLLSYVLPRYRGSLVSQSDPGPLWAQDGVIEGEREVTKVGYIQSLTWAARRTRLFPSAGGTCSRCGRASDVLVRGILCAQAWLRPDDAPTWRDPWAAYRESEREGELKVEPVRPQAERGLWRDFTALFLTEGGDDAMRPRVVRQLDYLIHDGVLSPDAPVRFDAFALRFERAKDKTLEWTHDSFNFPAAVIESEDTAVTIKTALQEADEVAYDLVSGLRMLHPIMDRDSRDAAAVKAALASVIRQVLRRYWSSLEGVFREQLHSPLLVATEGERVTWLDEWRDAVRTSARDVLEAALDDFEADADDLRRQQKARARFYSGLKKHLGGDL